jgi:hypothetical protein
MVESGGQVTVASTVVRINGELTVDGGKIYVQNVTLRMLYKTLRTPLRISKRACVNNIKLSTNYLVQSNTTLQYLSSNVKCFGSTKHRQILLYKN